MIRFRFVAEGSWSGGGQAFLSLAAYAAARHPVLAGGPDAVPVFARNVPVRPASVRRPFVLVPQNAWPWVPAGAEPTELPRLWGLRAMSELFLRRASAVLRVSSSIPRLGRVDHYSPVIHNVLDPGFEEALAAADRVETTPAEGRVVTIGSCYSYRNLERLVQAHVRSGDRRQLLVAGPVGSRALAHRLGAAAQGSDRVVVRWGSVSRATCLAWYRAADTVVLPSRVEASPFSALEAYAVQPRVVLSDIPAHREILAAYGAETERAYVAVDDTDAWAAAIDASAEASGTHRALADAGVREEARERWSSAVAEWFGQLSEVGRGARVAG